MAKRRCRTSARLAWYGYEDEQSNSYKDYSSTRNVEKELWNEGSIKGNVITLNELWDGPEISAGDADAAIPEVDNNQTDHQDVIMAG